MRSFYANTRAMQVITAGTIKFMDRGYMTNAFVAPISSFSRIGTPTDNSNIINLPHVQIGTDTMTSAIVTPILPRQFENQNQSLGDPGAVYDQYRLKIFFPGDGPEHVAMVDGLKNEPLLIMMEDAHMYGYYTQLGSKHLPVYFAKENFRSGTIRDGIKGTEVEAIAVCRYFYNYNATIKTIVESYALANGLPLQDDIPVLAYDALPETIRSKASLLLVPLAYSSGVVYGLNRHYNLVSVTYSRSTNGTRINKDGYVEVKPPNMPRLNYDLKDNNCTYLVEPAATNLIANSVAYSGLNTNTGATVAAVPAVYNGATVLRINPGTEIGYSTSGDIGFYSGSYFVKHNTGPRRITLICRIFGNALNGSAVDGSAIISFNFDTKTFSLNGLVATIIRNVSYTYDECANGWYRFSITLETHNMTSNILHFRINSLNGFDGSVYACCQQIERGPGTSYIPTTGTSATRNADNYSFSPVGNYLSAGSNTVFMHLPVASGISTNTTNGLQLRKSANLTDDHQAICLKPDYYVHQYKAGSASGNNTVAATGNKLKLANQFGNGRLKQFVNGSSALDVNYTGSTTVNNFLLSNADATARLRVLAVIDSSLLNSDLITITS